MTWKEHEEKATAHAIEAFSFHKATYKVLDGIDTLEFSRPDSICYSLRVVFDHEHGNSVYICGNLGEAVIYPTCPATLKGMAECFTRRDESGNIHVNCGYFLEKVRASSDRYCWDYDTFIQDFKERCKEKGIDSADDFIDEHTGIWNDGVEVDNVKGITLSYNAKRDLEEIDSDYWEWVYDCGKRVSPRIILWLVAMRLAYEAVKVSAEGDLLEAIEKIKGQEATDGE